jgi:hypothetical protein
MHRTIVRPVFACALFGACAAALAVAWSCRPVPAAPPRPLEGVRPGDLAGRLHGLGLETIPEAADGDPGNGVFLCDRRREVQSLRRLLRQKGCTADWRGVVLLKRENHPDDVLYRQLDEWGDCGLYEPPYVFFGDAQWIARIRAELGPDGDGRRAENGRPAEATAP